MVALGHQVKIRDWKGFLYVWGGNSCFTAKGGPVQANRPSATISPSATIKPQCHHGGTLPPCENNVIGRFLTCLGWKSMFLLRKEAQYKQIGPSATISPSATKKVQCYFGGTGPPCQNK